MRLVRFLFFLLSFLVVMGCFRVLFPSYLSHPLLSPSLIFFGVLPPILCVAVL